MRVSPTFKWLIPYVELGLTYIPKKKITLIGEWKLGQRCGRGHHAAILTSDNKNYRVYFQTMYHPRTSKKALEFSKIDIVKTLAHEMAHMKEFDHTPAHTKLDAKLQSAFMNMLTKSGYISEEEEMNEKLL